MIDPNAVLDARGEWFEIYNPTVGEINMQGYTVKDGLAQLFIISTALNVPAGGYVVLGTNANTNINGGVAVDYAYPYFSLSNSGDEIIILDTTNTEVDRVEWGSSFVTSGYSQALSDPCTENWCNSPNRFGGASSDRGSPGAANDCN